MVHSPAYAANPDHVITITPYLGRVDVRYDGTTVAESVRALVLTEGSYRPTFYIPRSDCKMEHFIETNHSTKCPFKGSARYWTLLGNEARSENAAWGYDEPFDQVSELAGHVAFYSNIVDMRAEPDDGTVRA